jgi:hypothetical protein
MTLKEDFVRKKFKKVYNIVDLYTYFKSVEKVVKK